MAGYYDLDDTDALFPDLGLPELGEDEAGDSPASSVGAGVTPSPAVAAAPPAAPASSPAPDSMKALLRQYFQQNQEQQADLADAQGRAHDNQLFANIGQAGATIGAGLAGTGGAQVTPNTKAFDNLQATAQQPVADVQARAALQNQGNKTLQDYFLRKMMADSKIRGAQIGAGAKIEVAKGHDEQSGKNTQLRVDASKENTGTRVGAQDRRTNVLAGLGQQRVGLAKEGLDLRKGNQALSVAGKFANDKILVANDQQLGQIEKGLGQIDKGDFTLQKKADIEADMARILSGGGATSLGAQERIEFMPFEARYQKFIGDLKGVPQNLDLPEYRKQVKALFQGLRHDIEQIRQTRANKLGATMRTAVGGNDKAVQTLENAVQANQATPQERMQKNQINKKTGESRTVYSDDGGVTWHP